MAAHDPLFAGPYHRLTRPAGGAWWRLAATLVLGAVGSLVVSAAALLIVLAVAHALGFGGFKIDTTQINAGMLLGTNLGLALLIPLALLLTRLLYEVRPRWVASLGPGLRWRWLGRSLLIAGAIWFVLFVIVLASSLTSPHKPIGSAEIGMLVVVLLTQPLQAAGEEFLFRGYVMQSLGATRLPTWICIVVSSALFATAHLQFAPPLFADRFILGLALAWLALRTGGLESGIAIHTVKNMSVLIPAALLNQTSQAVEPTGVTWVPVIIDIVMLAIVLPLLVRAHDRRHRPVRPG